MKPREQFLDPDFRPEPPASLHCCRCQRRILRTGSNAHRWVYLRAEGLKVLHPDDVQLYRRDDDIGWQPIGHDCARTIGLEWSTPTAQEIA